MTKVPRSVCAVAAFLPLLAVPMPGQLVVKLNPQTVAEFDRYALSVEAQLQQRWRGDKNFLSLEDDPGSKQKVVGGDLLTQASSGNPQHVTEGLIHDWTGAVYLPHTDIKRVMELLRDFDNHKNIYPEVADSRTIRQNGDETVGYWKVQQRKGLVPVILEVEQNAIYKEVSPGKWICRAYAKDITEINTAPFSRGRRFPAGEGHGYLWRLYAYWSLESVKEGVLAECRSLSLSRDIPDGLAWAVGPYVQKAPQDSLASTLRETRKALEKADQ